MADIQHNCSKIEVITDIQKRVGRLEQNDREDYGSGRELALAISNIGETLLKVNENLDNLNRKNEDTNIKIDKLEGRVNEKIDDLEEKFQESENLNKVDLREISKTTYKEKLIKFGVPIGAFAGIIAGIIEILKAIKIIK